jgi:hypothetical protein
MTKNTARAPALADSLEGDAVMDTEDELDAPESDIQDGKIPRAAAARLEPSSAVGSEVDEIMSVSELHIVTDKSDRATVTSSVSPNDAFRCSVCQLEADALVEVQRAINTADAFMFGRMTE